MILSDAVHTARKEYDCDTRWFWEQSGYQQDDVSAADWLLVQTAIAQGWKIVPGQRYRKVIYIEGGALSTYRGAIDMDELCQRLELFDE